MRGRGMARAACKKGGSEWGARRRRRQMFAWLRRGVRVALGFGRECARAPDSGRRCLWGAAGDSRGRRRARTSDASRADEWEQKSSRLNESIVGIRKQLSVFQQLAGNLVA